MKREEKKRLNRQKLVDAAYELMTTKGVRQTSVRDVSDLAGISFVTMYKYFQNKDELIVEVALKIFEPYFQDAMRIADQPGLGFMERMHAFTAQANDIKRQFPEGEFDEIFGAVRESPRFAASMDEWNQKFWAIMIRNGRQSGFITTTVSDEAIRCNADMLTRYVNLPGHVLPEAMIGELERLFVNGLQGE
jgi:AcrR family transcriptional regulator